MSFACNLPVASAYDWKPISARTGVKNIFRSLTLAGLSFTTSPLTKQSGLHTQPSPAHQTITAAGDLLALVSISIGLLTLFAGLSLL